MKRFVPILVIAILGTALLFLTACKSSSSEKDSKQPSPETTALVSASGDKSTSLSDIRKAAEEAGYIVTDGHNLVFMQDVTDGFSVEIVADGYDVIYSVIECKTEDAAIKNAKDIDDAGYNIAIRNGKLLTCYGVDKKDGTIHDILSSIISGKPVKYNP